MADRDISDLDKDFQPLVQEFIDRVNAAIKPSRCIITVTWRGQDDQNAAAAHNLSKATWGHSPHNCIDADGNPAARAFDFGILDDNGTYITNGADGRYSSAGLIAIDIDLVWGGSWTEEKDGCEPDFDHVEMKNWKSA